MRRNTLLALLVMVCLGAGSAFAADITALDNTDGGTASLTIFGTLFENQWLGPQFTVGATPVTIKNLTAAFSLFSGSAPSVVVHLGLFDIDSSGFPSNLGPLAADSVTILNVSTTPQYYMLESTLGGYTLAAGHSYALMVSGINSLKWDVGTVPACAAGWSSQGIGIINTGTYIAAGNNPNFNVKYRLVVTPTAPVPCSGTTWGQLKTEYR